MKKILNEYITPDQQSKLLLIETTARNVSKYGGYINFRIVALPVNQKYTKSDGKYINEIDSILSISGKDRGPRSKYHLYRSMMETKFHKIIDNLVTTGNL